MGITPIESDPVATSGVAATASSSNVGKFSSIFDAMGYGAQVVGPAGYYTTQVYAPSSAEVVGASVNATANYSGGTGMGSTPGIYSGGTPYYSASTVPTTGTSGLGSMQTAGLGYQAAVPTGSTDMLTMAQQQLADSQASSVSMLMVQDQMGQENRFFTTASNLMNSRDTMLSTIIRNVRVG